MLQPATQLYRYMSFDLFLQIVFSEKITAVRPCKWKDSFEQYWIKYLNTSEGTIKLEEYVKESIVQQEYVQDTVKKLKGLVNALYHFTFGICFTEAEDEELMWRASNTDDRTVMIVTDVAQVNRIGEENAMFGAVLKRMQYDLEDHCGIEDLLNKFGFFDGAAILNDPNDLILHKRKCFAYEREVRFLYTPDDTDELQDADGKVIELYDLEIPDLNGFIKGVMVCPTAKDRHVRLVEEICRHFNLTFLGKSELYDFKILT